MSEIKKIDSGASFTHVTAGPLAAFAGKAFARDAAGLTGCELSFGTLEPGTAVPFFHSHKQNEEVYVILRGAGDFQVDDDVFAVGEGSIVRVATSCDRSLRCTSAGSMLYICIQCREGSLAQCTMEDGVITGRAARW